jgi:OOP family OmpA-OmpF porin
MNRIIKTVGTLGLVGCSVIVSSYAVADDSGWYVGGNVGQSKAKIDDARIAGSLAGFTSTSIVDDNSDTGYKFFGGYKFNKNFALEGGYFNLGKFGYTATTTLPAGTLIGSTKLDGMSLDAVVILPVTEKFSAFGRIGMNYSEAKDNFTRTGAVPVQTNVNPTRNQMNPKAGLGLQYDFTQSLGVRTEAERYRINDAIGNKGDIDLISVGLVYRFGVKKPLPLSTTKAVVSEPVAAPVPPPVVALPPPVPLPVPVVETPAEMVKVVFSADSTADSLFAFGKADLSPSGKQALDKFTAELSGAKFEVVKVTGHADRIGSFDYNMNLSKRRAEVVSAYLVASTVVPSDKITAVGMGYSDPVTKPGECKGKKESKKLIACLAPDRRVEVEVSATRTINEIASKGVSR